MSGKISGIQNPYTCIGCGNPYFRCTCVEEDEEDQPVKEHEGEMTRCPYCQRRFLRK